MNLVVIGGGPGGYKAAFEAASLGAHVTLIERERLGGTCLNKGCIPTKTILKTAHLLRDVSCREELGLDAGSKAVVSVPALRTRTRGVIDELVGQLEGEARRRNVEVITGEGRVIDAHSVAITTDGTTQTLETDAIILATGSVPVELRSIDHTLPGVWTSDDAVALSKIPSSAVIMGGGVIGVEFACAWAAFGTQVTIIELDKQILPGNDKRVARTLATELKKHGIEILTGTSVERVEQEGDSVIVGLSNGSSITAEVLLSAVGRRPASENLGLEEAGVEIERGTVLVDSFYRTSIDGIYAIGDLIGGYMLAHVAEEEGAAAARNAIAYIQEHNPPASRLDANTIPACVYTTPEVAVVGMTKDRAVAEEFEVETSLAKFAGNGKALAEGESEGFVQLVGDKKTGRILGCQIVGPHAVEMIHEVTLAIKQGIDARSIASTTHAHPTTSEVIRLAAEMLAAKLEIREL